MKNIPLDGELVDMSVISVEVLSKVWRGEIPNGLNWDAEEAVVAIGRDPSDDMWYAKVSGVWSPIESETRHNIETHAAIAELLV